MQCSVPIEEKFHETYLPAFDNSQEAHPWISRSHAHAWRPGDSSGATRQGTGSFERLNERKRYRRRQRLRTADIAALFAGGRTLRRPGFTVLLKANALGIPRFNVIVPKRAVPHAVNRNRLKRRLREWFRIYQGRLGSQDISIRLTGKSIALDELAEILQTP